MDGWEDCPFCGGKDLRRQSRILGAGYVPTPQIGPRLAVHWIRCAGCSADGPEADDLPQAIASWNRRPTRGIHFIDGPPVSGFVSPHLTIPVTLDALRRGAGRESMMIENQNPRIVEVISDDLSAARERRDQAGLPSITTTAEPDGLSMDFDLGGDKPRGKR